MPRIKKVYLENMRASLKLLRGKKNLVGAEIGVSNGANARIILEVLNIKKLYLVDPWESYIEDGQEITMSLNSRLITEKNLEKFKEKVVFIQNDSVEASKQIEDKSLDFVYIDANHQYESVKADIEAWLPKVKNNGFLAGHDYGKKGVQKAVDELLPQRETTMGDWYFLKPCR